MNSAYYLELGISRLHLYFFKILSEDPSIFNRLVDRRDPLFYRF